MAYISLYTGKKDIKVDIFFIFHKTYGADTQ